MIFNFDYVCAELGLGATVYVEYEVRKGQVSFGEVQVVDNSGKTLDIEIPQCIIEREFEIYKEVSEEI